MESMARLASILLFALLASVSASAQEPGVDEEACKGQDFDAFDLVINKDGEMQSHEGAGQELTSVLEKAMAQEISASAQATITPASDAVLIDVLAVLVKS